MDYINPPAIYSDLCPGFYGGQMSDGTQLIILDEQVLYQSGSFRKVRRYVKGKHPHLGPMLVGWSGGWETIWETEVIRPIGVFRVVEEAREAA